MCKPSFPDPRGHVIAALEVGDEVKIKAGAGRPVAEQEVIEVIISISGFSALTHTGRMLACTDGDRVTANGVHYDDESQYPTPVTDEARHLLAEAQKGRVEFRGIFDDLGPEDWATAFREDLL